MPTLGPAAFKSTAKDLEQVEADSEEGPSEAVAGKLVCCSMAAMPGTNLLVMTPRVMK